LPRRPPDQAGPGPLLRGGRSRPDPPLPQPASLDEPASRWDPWQELLAEGQAGLRARLDSNLSLPRSEEREGLDPGRGNGNPRLAGKPCGDRHAPLVLTSRQARVSRL